MTERTFLLRYNEIALKGSNRSWFEERLAINARKLIQRTIGEKTPISTDRLHGRVLLRSTWDDATEAAARDAFSRIFGLSSYSPMYAVPTNLEAITEAALQRAEISFLNIKPKTFRVFTRRSDKALPLTSMEIDRHIGQAIHKKFPELKVDLENPDFTLGLELRFNQSYIWTEKINGPEGLPVGTGGKTLTLLSGGIDSPVAAITTMKRGATVHYLHFYGTPFVGEEALNKVISLAKIANRYQPDPQPLLVVPFGKLQEKIALVTNPKMRTLLYRRMMVRIASMLAERMGAQALITGESLGQVASQTIENMTAINSVTRTMILRPLIGMDKSEIILRAKQWGTYQAAIGPGDDCCTLFADRHPSIRASESLLAEQESRLPIEEMTLEAVNSVEIHRIT